MASPDIPALGCCCVTGLLIDSAEEQVGTGVVDQRLGAAVQRGREILAGDRVAAVSLQRQRLVTHPGEFGARSAEVVTFTLQLG